MSSQALRILHEPRLTDAAMVLGFTGWMDGGDVSTGVIGWLLGELTNRRIAEVMPHDFFIHSFPGSMEISALLRPHVRTEEGLIRSFQFSANELFCAEAHNLLLFRGREPNLRWDDYADCVFEIAARMNVRRLYFLGSVAGVTPHTREARMYCTVSHEKLKDEMGAHGLRFTNYEGPSSFASFLLTQALRHGLEMVSLVAEVPAYIQDRNPKCIETVARKLTALLGLSLDFEELRRISDDWEHRVNRALREKVEVLEYVKKLEADYDDEVFDAEMGDLKAWLEQRGLRLD